MLSLSSNQLNDGKHQAGISALRSLDVPDNIIGTEGAAAFVGNTTLKSLNLAHTFIGEKSVGALVGSTTLTALDERDNFIQESGQRQVDEMLQRYQQTDFKNEVSTIGQGLRNDKSLFGQLPKNVTMCLVKHLANGHGLFARKEQTIEALYPDCKKAETPKAFS